MAVVAAVSVVLLGNGARWVIGVRQYDGLRAGGGVHWTGPGIQVNRTYTHGSELVLPYAPDAEFTFGFSLMNAGDKRVRITKLPPLPLFLAEVSVHTTPARRADGGAVRENLAPFRAFTLKPEQQVWVEYRIKTGSCPGSGGDNAVGFRVAPFTYRVGPITRGTAFDLPMGLAVVGGPSAPCTR